MATRKSSTDRSGKDFPATTEQAVWEKGKVVAGNDKNVFRQDIYGNWMQRDKYGDRHNQYGWEIDHIKPVSKGGSDELTNLQPLQWKNNLDKGDTYP